MASGWGLMGTDPTSGSSSSPSSSKTTGGWGLMGGAGTPAKKISGSGGFLGSLEHIGHEAAHPFKAAGRYAAQQGEDVGTGLYGIGTGMYNLGKSEGQTLANDVRGRNNKLNSKEWSDLLHGHVGRMFKEAAKMKGANSPEAQLSSNVKASTLDFGQQVKQVAEHPQRNLFQTGLTLLPLLGGAAGTVGRAVDATAAARAGMSAADVAKAAVKGTEPGVRTLQIPGNKLVAPKTAEGERAVGPEAKVATKTPVQLNQGRSYLSRGGAKAHDVLAQRSLDKMAAKGKSTPLSRYAMSRGAKSLEEAATRTANVRDIAVNRLQHAKAEKSLSSPESSLATILRAGNVLPEEMAASWRRAADEGVVHVPQEDGTVAKAKVTPADRKRMLSVARVADSLADKGVLQRDANGDVAVNEDLYPKLASREAQVQHASDTREAAIQATNPRVSAEGLQGRQNLVARAAGVDRQGKAFVSLKPYEKQSVLSRFARSANGSIPQTKGIPLGEHATGTGLARGYLPGEAAREVAGGLRTANRVRGTNDLRGATAAHGHAVRMTPDDWLVAKDLPSRTKSLPDEMKTLLGRLRDTSLSPKEEHAIAGKWNDWVKENLVNRHATERVGEQAPEGWTWVHKSLVPDSLKHNAQARGGIEKQLAKLSTAVTGATVYFKPGHVPQRLVTNAAFNAVHGSLNPLDIDRTRKTLGKLTQNNRHRLAAATGTHGYQSLPMEGVGKVASVTRAGANAYSRYIDAFFRQNAALYELRRIGYKTPEQVREALDAVEHHSKLPGHELMKIHGAFNRATRAAGDYETNALEKRTIQRFLWFYGFSKAATRFAGHTVAEHPGKAAVIGTQGTQGNKEASSVLGPMSSYEGGLTPISGGQYPRTLNLSSLIPTGTVAQEAEALQHPLGQDGVQAFLNPLYAGAQAVMQGKGAKGFLGQATSPTPEMQVLKALVQPHRTGGSALEPTSTKNLFGSTWESALARALGGAALTPRRVNKARGNEYAAREHQKKREITIYSP